MTAITPFHYRGVVSAVAATVSVSEPRGGKAPAAAGQQSRPERDSLTSTGSVSEPGSTNPAVTRCRRVGSRGVVSNEPGSLTPHQAIAARRIIVCGSRKWHDRGLIADTLNRIVLERGYRFPSPIVVHGDARGADKLAADEAAKAGLLTEAHPANWTAHGKIAGFLRNEEMAALGADLCVAFWDGQSNGTRHMIETAERHGIPVEVIVPAGVTA